MRRGIATIILSLVAVVSLRAEATGAQGEERVPHMFVKGGATVLVRGHVVRKLPPPARPLDQVDPWSGQIEPIDKAVSLRPTLMVVVEAQVDAVDPWSGEAIKLPPRIGIDDSDPWR